MQMKDNCAICRVAMLRNAVVQLQPCRHLLHQKCGENLFGVGDNDNAEKRCPICRARIINRQRVQRKIYKRHTRKDREKIVASANRGDDWILLSQQLEVPYKTSYHWVRLGKENAEQKEGRKPKILSEEQLDEVVRWLEDNPTYTLRQVKEKVSEHFSLQVYMYVATCYIMHIMQLLFQFQCLFCVIDIRIFHFVVLVFYL